MILELVNAAVMTAVTPVNQPAEAALEPSADPPTVSLQDDEEPVGEWTGAIALGLYQAYGNTERSSATLNGNAKLRRENDRFNLAGWWYYGDETDDTGDSTVTDRRVGGSFKYDYFLSEKSYIFGNALAEQDYLARLQLRWILGAGYGRQFKEEENFKLAGEAGLSYVSQDYETPEPTADDPNPRAVGPDEYLAARLAYNIEWTPGKGWTLSQTGEIYPSIDGSDNFYSKLNSEVRYDLSEKLFTAFQWLWDYNSNPPSGTKQSDHRLFLTVGYTF